MLRSILRQYLFKRLRLFKRLHLCFVKNTDATCLVIKKIYVTVHESHGLLCLKYKKKGSNHDLLPTRQNAEHAPLFTWTVEICFGRTGSGSKLKNTLNRVQPSKIKNIFFNCILFEKLVFNIIQWHCIN